MLDREKFLITDLLEGTHRDHWVQPRLHTAPPKPNPTSQSGVPTLPELRHSGPCPLPWAARSMPTALWGIAFPKPPAALSSQLHAVLSGPVAVPREHSSVLPLRSLWGAAAAMMPLLSLLCFAPNKPRHLSCSSYIFPSEPFTTFAAPLWTLSNSFMSFLYCGA